ncbi:MULTISPECIES: ComEC/Rec2 family competence protein [unclassified Rhodococcus (in: high G+C Gram-positive bacteria)]|uniref:ComEC/Rec2 family competence protein n=1 Tax=unclassified Rhodococcus (in: high G+C Gram-positive bacteria) TaxID=192944 RepID=UPI001639E98F|nr:MULTISPECIES: ComEC/Rec2 family competence protein [unclassified Rhodococcus (in: high G+C Gram-positive bacteria)]MBC2638740.1 ComEC/Rec2 family competence protein [Rhodococcus sp. 3A]MBC2896519.1 ComEC/Rec2 family competence protein [Rhodococcus sp. 4CII]
MSEGEPRPLDLRLLPFAGICWAATVIGILGGSAAAWTWVVALSGTGILLTAGHILRGPRRWTAGAVAILLFGSCCGGGVAWRVQNLERHPLTELARNGTWVTLVVTPVEDPRPIAGFGRRVLVHADVVEIRRATETISTSGAVVVLAPAEGWLGLLPGQEVVLRGQLSPPRHRDLSVATVRVSGPPIEVGLAPPHQRWAGALRARFAAAAAVLPEDEAGLLPGLVVGDTSALPPDLKEDFTATGLTHLTAVSGANVSILLGAVLLLVRAVGIGPRTGAALAAAALIAFVVIARPSPSVLRAAAMGSVALLALVSGRRKQAMPALAAGVIALLTWSPALAVDFGFILSASATAALIVIAPVWVDRLVGRGWPRAVAESVAVTVAAFVVTAPIVAAMAGTVSLVSICANVLVAPVVGVITVVGAVAALIAAVSVPAAAVVVRLTHWPLWWLVTVAEGGARIPGASIPVPSGPAGAVVVLGAVLAAGVALRSRGPRLVLVGITVGALVLWAPIWPSSLGRLV